MALLRCRTHSPARHLTLLDWDHGSGLVLALPEVCGQHGFHRISKRPYTPGRYTCAHLAPLRSCTGSPPGHLAPLALLFATQLYPPCYLVSSFSSAANPM